MCRQKLVSMKRVDVCMVTRTFTRYMRALGVPKDQCLEFIRRQAKLANLSRGTFNYSTRYITRLVAWTSLSVVTWLISELNRLRIIANLQ